MIFEWDPVKNAANKAKHGLAFDDVKDFEWDTARSFQAERNGETRIVAVGFFGDVVRVIVYAMRGPGTRRIISFRTASAIERRLYEQDQGSPSSGRGR